jgi:hypothetical protein
MQKCRPERQKRAEYRCCTCCVALGVESEATVGNYRPPRYVIYANKPNDIASMMLSAVDDSILLLRLKSLYATQS